MSDQRTLLTYYRGPVSAFAKQHQGWVRVFRHGVAWRSTLVRPMSLERNGLARIIAIGPWRLWWLRKEAARG